ncbi:hypothetical protein N7466_008819 [Penicillium verhagenii]|uniref:uncharacterized protein n=1 Tax=Penicillium verhagenii TaxID=1562060 RepID=UPI0025456DC8|nr:uncharacterized protein N7466_008819 [Penicillium verhagenii]KAJ5924632.1 hypothetical protein N7466_008819 [Penicillium verhagenii]
MRYFIGAALLIAGVTAQSLTDIETCADAILSGIDSSALETCSDKSTKDCICSGDFKDAVSDAAASTCKDAGISPDDLKSAFCSSSSSSDSVEAPARHASKPMEPASNMNSNMEMAEAGVKRAYAPPSSDVSAAAAMPQVIYVTETKTECGCKATSTPARFDPMHLSQIPVNVPASSSVMGSMAAASASSPVWSNGVMVVGGSASSRVWGSMATPTPSGASAQGFRPFKGAAPAVSAVAGSFAAVGVAAVMGLMFAL